MRNIHRTVVWKHRSKNERKEKQMKLKKNRGELQQSMKRNESKYGPTTEHKEIATKINVIYFTICTIWKMNKTFIQFVPFFSHSIYLGTVFFSHARAFVSLWCFVLCISHPTCYLQLVSFRKILFHFYFDFSFFCSPSSVRCFCSMYIWVHGWVNEHMYGYMNAVGFHLVSISRSLLI